MIDRPDDYSLPPYDAPSDLKKHHCGWYGHGTRNCKGCKRRFLKKDGSSELSHCPDCGRHRYCMASPVKGRTACKMHGAGTLTKPEGRSPTKGGRFSKHLQGTSYLKAFEDSLADPNQLRLHSLIALNDARIEELISRVNTKDSSQVWLELEQQVKHLTSYHDSLKASLAGFIRATNMKDKELARNYLDTLANSITDDSTIKAVSRLVEEGLSDWAIWKDAKQEAEHRRKLADTERKLMVESHRMVTVEKMMMFIEAFLADLNDLVPDPHIPIVLGKRFEQRLKGHSVETPKTKPSS